MKKLITILIFISLTIVGFGQTYAGKGIRVGKFTTNGFVRVIDSITVNNKTTPTLFKVYAGATLLNPSSTINVINVKDYGALGNGIANDITAINTAMAAAHAAGKSLYFPAGTYNVGESDQNRACVRLLPNTPVFGDGDNTIIKRIDVSGSALGSIMGPDYTARYADSTQNNYFISNLKLIGASNGRRSGRVTGATEHDGGLRFISAKAWGVNKVVIDHVTASGFNKESIAVWHCQELSITNCSVVNCNHDAYNPGLVSKMTFTGNSADSVNFGMEYLGGNAWTAKDTTDYAIIHNNIFKNCYGYGIVLEAGDNISIENNTLSAVPGWSITLGQVCGIFITNTNVGNGIRNLQIIGNNIFGFGNVAIGSMDMVLAATNTRVHRLSIKNNILHDVGMNAIWLKQYDLSKYGQVDITGNTIYDWNRVDNGTSIIFCAIGLEKMDSVFISGNRIFNTKSIQMNDPLLVRNCDNITFINNDVKGNKSRYWPTISVRLLEANTNLYISNNPGLDGWVPSTNPYRVIHKKIGWHGATGVDFLQPDVANLTAYPIDLGTIIPAKAKVVDIQIICTEALAGSGLHEILFTAGNVTGGGQFIASISCNDLNEVAGIINPTLPTAIVMSTSATHVWIGSTPNANWNTYTAGTWDVFITVIEYLPFVY